jgi:hypothetical protein
MLLTSIALGALPVAEVSVPQLDGTDNAPTLVARPTTAVTEPPACAEPTEPSVVATLLSPALTSVNAAAVESAAVAPELEK